MCNPVFAHRCAPSSGDYSPTPTSVIGALLRNLEINVQTLARDKEEDLRKLYSCWWSRPLPADKPYNRLLCFETKVFGSGRPQEVVSDVFRCLVPLFNNKDGTVIAPLLNTGNQGFDQVVMLKGMVEAAVNWMKAGLPLRMLKIVLFCQGKDDEAMAKAAERDYSRVFKSFEDLKECYMMKDLTPKVQQNVACSQDSESPQEQGSEQLIPEQANSDFNQ